MNPSFLDGLITGFVVLIGVLGLLLIYLFVVLNKIDQDALERPDDLKLVGTDKLLPKKESKLQQKGNKS